VAASLAIEPRDPFMDCRLIQFALSLPLEQLQQDGWPKFLLRRSMNGLVPDQVRWRRGKEHLGAFWSGQLFETGELRSFSPEQLVRTIAPYARVTDRRALSLALGELENCKDWQDIICF